MNKNEMIAGMLAQATRVDGTQTLPYEKAVSIVEALTTQQLSECLDKLNQTLPFISSASRMDSFLNVCMQSLKQNNPQHPLLESSETTKHHFQAHFEPLSDQEFLDCAKFSQEQTKHDEELRFEHLSVHQTKAVHRLLKQTLKNLSEILHYS